MRFPAFVGPSYVSQSPMADCEQTINFYTETIESEGAKTRRILAPLPGYVTFGSFALAPNRCLWGRDGLCFSVTGFGLVQWSSAGVGTSRGTLSNDALPATIDSSGDAGGEVWVVSGGLGYTYTPATTTLAAQSSAGTGLVQGGYLDGFFLALDDTSTFKISNLLDGATWDPLQIAQRNDAPDRWQALLVSGKYIWLFGSETTSVLYDAGSFPFPFALVPGVLIKTGIAARFSAKDMNGTPIWLTSTSAGQGQIVQASGFGPPTRISTYAVEYAIQNYTTISDAVAFVFQYQGHWFYQINFPSANDAWLYDASSGAWSKPLYWDPALAAWQCSRAQYFCHAFGKHLVADRATGSVYQLSSASYVDAGGAALRRLRRCPFPPMTSDASFVFLKELQIFMDVGIGLSSGQGSDPQVVMRLSRDGGRTWGNEHWTSAGAIGKYLTRVTWNRLGRFRDGMGVLEVSCSDPAPYRWTDAAIDVSVEMD